MREPVTLTGVVTSLGFPAAGSAPVFEFEMLGPAGMMRIAFVGFRSIAGITVGRRIEVTGVVADTIDGPTIFNPTYTLKGEDS